MNNTIKTDTTEKIQCEICGKECNGKIGLRLHQRWEHDEGGREKMVKAAKQAAVTRVAKNKEKEKELKCKLCDQPPYQSVSGLRYHMQAKHGKLPEHLGGAQCPECGYISSKAGVALHRRLRHGIIGATSKSRKQLKSKKPAVPITTAPIAPTNEVIVIAKGEIICCPQCGLDLRPIRVAMNYKEE